MEDDYFVIHIASTKQLDALNNSAATLDYGQSEVTENNIELGVVDSEGFRRLEPAEVKDYLASVAL